MTKSIFASKTFWFGIAQMAFGVAGLVTGWIDPQLSTGLIMTGLASIGFRATTTQAVHLVAPSQD